MFKERLIGIETCLFTFQNPLKPGEHVPSFHAVGVCMVNMMADVSFWLKIPDSGLR